MQLKAKEVLYWHPIDGVGYITQGAVYQVIGALRNGVFVIDDDNGLCRVVSLDNCAHGVVWEVVDAS